jgi:hypothetical protein
MYRIEDIDEINKNINKIQDAAILEYKTNYEPTLAEYKIVNSLILDFIKKKKRIIYGGYAQNLLIKKKNIDDIFYTEVHTPDLEFYTHEPVSDVIELCNFLKSKNFKYISGQEGVHEGTYKIFVNFENYCDISYLPKNISDNCLKIEANGVQYTHPYFMYIDFFRMFTDPLTSFWRLDKAVCRFLKLIKNYPFTEAKKTMIINETDKDILKTIRRKIIHKSKYIVIGKYAYNYYIKKNDESAIDIDFYEIITSDYEKEIQNIYNILVKYLNKDNITVKEYVPFFEFFDKRSEYYYKNKLIFKVYGNNNRCIVYKYSEKKECYFGTFQLVFLYLLSNYNYYIINNNNIEANNNYYMLYNIIKAKNNYLNKHNKTVMDKTPFEEFIIICIGKAVEPKRESFIKRHENRKKGLKSSFIYEPNNNTIKIPKFIFDNKSGNQIINSKQQILKKK